MESSSIHVLVTAFAPVPGTSPHATALLGMAGALHADLDMVTVKTEDLAHLERFGDSRMFRVPVGVGDAAERREAFGRAVSRQLEAQAYDVVHVRGPIEGRIVAAQRRNMGFHFVYEVATFPDEAEGPRAEALWEEAHEQCLEEASLILVPTEAASRSLAERGHAGKVAVVPPGVDVNTFDWWPSATGDASRILYLGSFAADRDLFTVLGAIKEVAKDRPVEVLVAGEPAFDRRERLRTVVGSFGLTDVVTVRGEPRAAAIPMLIGSADLCLAPASATPRFQDHGDLPQPLLEYLACRRPVIAAAVPGLADVLRDDKEGLVYPPGDEATLAEGILTLLWSDTLRMRLVESAYDRVRWTFSDGARRRRIAEVYEMLMTGSQQYDPWDEGFSQDLTGEVRVPSDLIALDAEDVVEMEPETIPPSASLSEAMVFVPEETPDEHPTPAYERSAGEDTRPGVSPPDGLVPDLPDSPTVLTAAPRNMEDSSTNEVRSPAGDPEPDTGEVPSPDTDPSRPREVDTNH